MTQPVPHLLLFDLDGTLTDAAPGITACIRHSLHELGLPQPAESDLRKALGPPLQNSFRDIFGIDDDGVLREAIRIYRERFSVVGILENEVYPGVFEALSTLRDAGHQLRVATSKPKIFADRVIDHFELRTFFPQVYGPALSGEKAEKTELLKYVLEREQASPSSTWMVGDRRHDMVGAKNNHMTALGVLWGYGSTEELEQAGADALVDQVHELPAAIRAMARDSC